MDISAEIAKRESGKSTERPPPRHQCERERQCGPQNDFPSIAAAGKPDVAGSKKARQRNHQQRAETDMEIAGGERQQLQENACSRPANGETKHDPLTPGAT